MKTLAEGDTVIGRGWSPFVVVLAGVTALACAEPRPGEVALRIAGTPGAAGDSVVVARGSDTIVVRNAEVVLREIQLQLGRTGECEEDEDERCAMVAPGPARYPLPLGPHDTALAPVTTVSDTYATLQLEIYRATPERDSAFVAAHPEIAGASVRASGSFSRAGARHEFVFVSDLDGVLELELPAPLVVSDGRVSSLVLGVDVAGWFLAADGTALIDPATAAPGGANAAQVRDNLRMSLGVRVPSSP